MSGVALTGGVPAEAVEPGQDASGARSRAHGLGRLGHRGKEMGEGEGEREGWVGPSPKRLLGLKILKPFEKIELNF